MIPDGRITYSTRSPKAALLADENPGSSTALPAIASPSDVPPRPSTAPPSSDATSAKEPQTRTALVSNLRARNLLLQKAISHIDDAVLHLMAARSGIPSAKIQQVRGEARNRKDLLDRVDRAIRMAQNGELSEERVASERFSGTVNQRPSTESGPDPTFRSEALSGTPLPAPPNVTHQPPSDHPLDVPQLRRSSSQPHLGLSPSQSQVPTKIYTLPELVERRKVLQESIQSWQRFLAELHAAQSHHEARAEPDPPLPNNNTSIHAPSALSASQDPSSWTAKYQRAQFEIKRREDLLLRLNQAIAQVSHPALSQPTPEQFAALASYIPPALDKTRFDTAYAHFCQGKPTELNTTIVMPDASKPVIDVYSLHVAVMQEGSFARVLTRKSWDVVGGRLGFIQTAATATEPARSSPEIASHLEKAYRDRLQQFDHLYVSSVIETVRKRMAEQQKKP